MTVATTKATWYTIQEVATQAGISRYMVEQAMEGGQLKATMFGKRPRISPEALDAFLVYLYGEARKPANGI